MQDDGGRLTGPRGISGMFYQKSSPNDEGYLKLKKNSEKEAQRKRSSTSKKIFFDFSTFFV